MQCRQYLRRRRRRRARTAEEAYCGKSNTASANVMEVYSDRLLTQMEATLKLGVATQGAWVVYEFVGGEHVLRLDQDMQFTAGDHNYDSGELDFELHAGHRYAFGIHLDRGCCYDSTAPGSDLLSFGKVIGASFGGGGDYYDRNELLPN